MTSGHQATKPQRAELARRLPPALFELLEAVMEVGGDLQTLADYLGVTRDAVNNRARRLRDLLDMHSLLDAVVYAVNNDLAQPHPGKSPSHREGKRKGT